MPGTMPQYLMRSRRVWTFSSNRLCLSTDMGYVGIPFGIIFSVAGLTAVGIIPFIIFAPKPMEIWKLLILVPVVALIGLGHFAGGVMCLWRQRSTFDRRRRTISTRDGWLGGKRRRYPMDQYSSICVARVPRPWHYYSPLDTLIGISLMSQDGAAVVVGYAATDELAAEVENELRRFLDKPPSD